MSAEIGRQEGLRVELAGGVADEKPADRHRRNAAAIPQRGAGYDLDDAIGSAVPETDPIARPGYVAILEDGFDDIHGLISGRTGQINTGGSSLNMRPLPSSSHSRFTPYFSANSPIS